MADRDEVLWQRWTNRPIHQRILGFQEWVEQEAVRAPSILHIPAGVDPRPRHKNGTMNRLETKYAQHLEMRKRAGEIEAYAFEAVKLRLAVSTFLTIDFVVVMPSGAVELHEVKGYWEDDARVKIKVAAQMFPWWRILAVQWDKPAKDWKFEVIHAR